MRRSAVSRLLAVIAVLACSIALTVTPAGALDETGYFIGTITSASTGDPIAPYACVQAYATPTDIAGSACTGSDGTYTIAVPMGTYRLRVYDPNRHFATRWAYAADSYDSADPIMSSTGGGTVVNVALLDAGAIVGTVTDVVTGQPPLQACVEVMAVGSEDTAAYACTDFLGQFRAVVPDAGQYNVRFSAEFYVPEWYSDRPTRDLADVVTVSGGQDTTADAQLTPLGQVSGRVTNRTGFPLAFMRVEAYAVGVPTVYTGADTDFDGTYQIRGLPAGQYQILFVDRSFGAFVSEWWNDSPDRAHAVPVTVILGSDISGLNAALGNSGLITGTVTDATTGQPLSGVCIRPVLAATGELVEGSQPQCTGTDGSYRVNAVGGTFYKLQFQPTDPAYLAQWYRDKTNEQSANKIRVPYNQTVPHIDVALHRAS